MKISAGQMSYSCVVRHEKSHEVKGHAAKDHAPAIKSHIKRSVGREGTGRKGASQDKVVPLYMFTFLINLFYKLSMRQCWRQVLRRW